MKRLFRSRIAARMWQSSRWAAALICGACLFAGRAELVRAQAEEGVDPSRPEEGPPEPAKPADDAAWERLFQESLKAHCRGIDKAPKAAPIPVALGGWTPLQTAAASVTGLVLLGEGNTTKKGTHAATLKKLVEYVRSAAGQDDPSHGTWSLGFGILFLSEAHRAEPTDALKTEIGKLVKTLETGRQGTKGWNHGLKAAGHPYGSFMAPTIWCAAALGAAREQGVAVDEKGLAETFQGLRSAVGASGGGTYFSESGAYPDATVGRSGGLAWALGRFAAEDSAVEVHRARAFIQKHVPEAPLGHGSWMINFGWSALAASAGDDEFRKAFWDVHRKTIRDARKADGTFPPQKWNETSFNSKADSKPRNVGDKNTWPDPMYGDAWATTWMLLAWQAERGKSVLVHPPAAAPPKKPKAPAGR